MSVDAVSYLSNEVVPARVVRGCSPKSLGSNRSVCRRHGKASYEESTALWSRSNELKLNFVNMDSASQRGGAACMIQDDVQLLQSFTVAASSPALHVRTSEQLGVIEGMSCLGQHSERLGMGLKAELGSKAWLVGTMQDLMARVGKLEEEQACRWKEIDYIQKKMDCMKKKMLCMQSTVADMKSTMDVVAGNRVRQAAMEPA